MQGSPVRCVNFDPHNHVTCDMLLHLHMHDAMHAISNMQHVTVLLSLQVM